MTKDNKKFLEKIPCKRFFQLSFFAYPSRLQILLGIYMLLQQEQRLFPQMSQPELLVPARQEQTLEQQVPLAGLLQLVQLPELLLVYYLQS